MAEQGPLSGQTVGNKYWVGDLLGAGGFGVVYRAQHIHLQRQQAIKVLLEHHFLKSEFRTRFLREARIVAALDHPYIIHLDDFWVEPTCAYLVMPFISGGTLQDILQKQQSFLDLGRVISYLEYICAALDYAHARGVAHLDLKPLNLLMHEDGRLLLSDFGLAHLMKQGAIEGGTSLSFGTPHYMAPEHIRGKPERRSDLFSLGVILYQMLVGRRPFQGLPPEAVMLKNITEWPSPPRAFRSELPQEVEDVVGKALAKQPEQRYQTAGDLLAAFKKALATPAKPPIASSRYDQEAPRPRRSKHLRLDVAQLTDVGRKRPHNEDNMAYVIPKDPQVMARKGALFIVADGMQEYPAGEVASEIAVDTVSNAYYQDDSDDVAVSLSYTIKRANSLIHQRAAENMLRSGMGTTCVATVLRDNVAYIANVGDSRAYLIRDHQMTQVSQDHSWVEEQVHAGLLTRDQARSHALRNVITRDLGRQAEVDVDVFMEQLQEGDSLVLCSDGLSDLVGNEELLAVIDQDVLMQESVYHLVERANENGGDDNITVIAIRVLELG
jgi:serine/threonine protein kinase